MIGMTPSFVSAHGDKYLEFNPDMSSSLKDVDVAIPSQIFFAQNDFLGGFDLWLANPGSAGTAIFALLNEQGIVIAIKTVTIPTIAVTSSGTKFHVDLNSQLPVLADDKYSIRITTSMPEIRLYYSDRIQVISHNAPFVSPYVAGVAMLGGEEQYFSFKYALYETNETSAPIISNIGWSVVSETQMKIDFNANEAVDYRIEYGPSGQEYDQVTNFFGDYEFCTEGILTCAITIPVSPDTTYQYRLTAKDVWGNQGQVTGTFASGQSQVPTFTPPPADIPSIISNLRIVDVANNSVSVAWTTNEATSSRLLVVLNGFISVTAVSDPTFELEHYLEIVSGLSGSTPYSAEVTSIDLGSNQTEASISFTTLGAIPTPTLTPSPSPTTSPTNSPNPSPIVSGVPPTTGGPSPSPQISTSSLPSPEGAHTGTIEWNAPTGGEPSDGYRIDIFDKDGKLVRTVFAQSSSRSTDIPELNNGEYTVVVYANNDGVFKKVAPPTKLKIEPSFVKRILGFWPYLLAAAILIGILIWQMLKRKAPPAGGSNPAVVS